jgi:hypothetical protein
MVIGFWVLTVLVALLVLANLGTMREIFVLRSELAAFTQLVTTPPAPGWLDGGPVPDVLARFHRQFAAAGAAGLLLVFIDGACPTCRRLVSDISAGALSAGAAPEVMFIFPEAADRDQRAASLAATLERSGFRCVLDDGHRLHRAAGIYGTPSALRYTRDHGTAFQAGVDVEWIEEHTDRTTSPPAPEPATAPATVGA